MSILEPGHFIVNGVRSWSKDGPKILIQNRPDISTPRRKREFKTPLAVSGELIFDENAYESTTMTLELLIEGETEEEVIANRDKLYMMFNTAGYANFTPYFDPDKLYRVICTEPPRFTNKWWMQGNSYAEMELTVYPFKRFLKNDPVFVLSSKVITNPYSLPSLPLIEVTGGGDATITINGIDYRMKGINGSIFIDSETMSAYRKDEAGTYHNENNKIYFREFPVLKPGNNTVTVKTQDTVRDIAVTPRWRSLT